jgi:hypothetical protein
MINRRWHDWLGEPPARRGGRIENSPQAPFNKGGD